MAKVQGEIFQSSSVKSELCRHGKGKEKAQAYNSSSKEQVVESQQSQRKGSSL